MGRLTKIAIIGAGSHVFARNLITDFLSYPVLQESTISLMDIDEEALKLTTAFAEKLVSQHGLKKDKELASQAVLLDPLTSAVLTIDEILNMVDEMFKAEARYLKGYK